LGWSEYSNWRTEVGKVEGSLSQTADAIVQHADDVVQMSRLPLASLITEIRDEQGHAEMPRKIKAVILRQMKAAPALNMLSFVDDQGKLVATSGKVTESTTDFADRDYFRLHKNSPFPLPVVGKPIKSRFSGDWVLPITQRVTYQDGSFGGVVLSSVRVGHFLDFFRRFKVGAEGSFLLTRGDGVVLARGPAEEKLLGTNISAHELFSTFLKKAPTGFYSYPSPIDGSARIGAFSQSSVTGLVVLAAASRQEVLAGWIEAARMRWIYTAVLVAAVFLAVAVWRHMVKLSEHNAALVATREAEFHLLAEASSDVIATFDENGIREYVSPSAVEVLGIAPERLVGKSVYAGLDLQAEALVRGVAARIQTGSIHEKFVLKHVKPNGEEIWLETALSKLPSVKGRPSRAVAISRDITRQKTIEDELNTLASTDELTKLANRRIFNLRFEDMLQNARRTRSPLSLLIIDADHFKAFNDTYGHAAGDECLRQIGSVLQHCVARTADLACRYGGEEFAVLLANTDERGAVSVAEAIRRAVRTLGIPHAGNSPERVTVSVGTATSDVAAAFPVTAQQRLVLQTQLFTQPRVMVGTGSRVREAAG
jgi:diguanylate cyclase (GGDEF)-like protein/PAS domain S-box-containing protein